MKIFVNAISIAAGGGMVVLKHLLENMSAADPNVIYYVAAEPRILSLLPASPNIIGMPFSWVKKSPLHHLYWYEVILPALIRRSKADVCFSHTNFLPRRKLSCPSLLLMQHAGYFSTEFSQLYLQKYNRKITRWLWHLKRNWVYRSIKQATSVTVQTRSLANKIISKINLDENKLNVIPHGPGLLQARTENPREFPHHPIWRMGYITKFGVQKDFSALIRAVSLLKKANIAVKLILTLDANDPDCTAVWQEIRANHIENLIENHGEIAEQNKLTTLYQSLDLFIFPSLCESFGFTLVEAMASGLPLIISDTDSNKEIVGHAGIAFSQKNGDQLFEKIQQLITDKTSYVAASKKSIERAKTFDWNQAAKQTLNLLYHLSQRDHSYG